MYMYMFDHIHVHIHGLNPLSFVEHPGKGFDSGILVATSFSAFAVVCTHSAILFIPPVFGIGKCGGIFAQEES